MGEMILRRLPFPVRAAVLGPAGSLLGQPGRASPQCKSKNEGGQVMANDDDTEPTDAASDTEWQEQPCLWTDLDLTWDELAEGDNNDG
jgi:hypothetical protein